ncbi:TniQ family protein [Streptomyces sp. NPDC029216]|uniref:TniQ family protein n=1 Tax=Streptomyces sp. NPDC029216 TaxID=3154701 RepID=UPI0033D141DE
MPRRHHLAPRASILRLAPIQWETTVSYLQRLARRHHLDTAELLRGLGIPGPLLHPECTRPHGPYTSIELYLNPASRSLIADFAGIPEEHLAHALPQWNGHRDKPHAAPPKARLRLAPMHAVTGCPHCTLARTGQTHPVRQYLPDTALICQCHSTWMLGRHTLAGTRLPIEHASLRRAPEILAAHRAHVRFIKRWGPAADHALALAMNLTETWRRAAPAEESIWPARARPHRRQQARPPLVRPRPRSDHLPRDHHPRPVPRPPPPHTPRSRASRAHPSPPHGRRRSPGPALAREPSPVPRPVRQPHHLHSRPPPLPP